MPPRKFSPATKISSISSQTSIPHNVSSTVVLRWPMVVNATIAFAGAKDVTGAFALNTWCSRMKTWKMTRLRIVFAWSAKSVLTVPSG